MNRFLLTSVMAGGVLLFSANAQAAHVAGHIEQTGVGVKSDVVAADYRTGNNLAASYLTHINNARFALTGNDERAARRELRRAFGALEKLKKADGRYMTAKIKTGRTLYNYVSSDNYYYFPIEIESRLSTDDYLEPYKRTAENELEIVYLNVNPNNTDSQNLLFIADRYTRDGNYMEADAALGELIRATVETGKIGTLPQEKARLHLIMAKYHFHAGNTSAALNRLDNAELGIDRLLKTDRYRLRWQRLTQIKNQIANTRAEIAEGRSFTDADEANINAWISYLNEWSRV